MELHPKTVKIKSEGANGYALINESDFDENVHELFDAPDSKAKKSATKLDEKPLKPDDKLTL